jgi:hypothetical protein
MFVEHRASGETPIAAPTVNLTLHVLKRARALIAEPDGWTRHVLCAPRSNGIGMAYCAVGAVDAIANGSSRLGQAALFELARALPADCIGGVPTYNNNGDHANALAMFDRAIARLEQRWRKSASCP